MISVHLDDIRRADVVLTSTHASVVLRLGAFSRVCLVMKSEEQANMLAEAINYATDPHAPLYSGNRGGVA